MNLARLVRYGISGGLSAATHFGVGYALARAGVRPVVASAAGFGVSILVSYVLQHGWVFRSSAGHVAAGSRFLTVTAAAFALNTSILWAGTEVLSGTFVVAQAVALVAIPVLNYTLNSRWTFRVP